MTFKMCDQEEERFLLQVLSRASHQRRPQRKPGGGLSQLRLPRWVVLLPNGNLTPKKVSVADSGVFFHVGIIVSFSSLMNVVHVRHVCVWTYTQTPGLSGSQKWSHPLIWKYFWESLVRKEAECWGRDSPVHGNISWCQAGDNSPKNSGKGL